MALNADQIESYERDGYVVVKDVLTGAEMAELRAAADFFAEQALALTADSPIIELDDAPHLAGGPPLIRRLKSPHTHHAVFANALAHPGLLDIVEDLVGSGIRWIHTKLNAKHPGGSALAEWHADWGYYPHTNDSVLEVGIAIDPVHRGQRLHAGRARLPYRSRPRSQPERPLRRSGEGGRCRPRRRCSGGRSCPATSPSTTCAFCTVRARTARQPPAAAAACTAMPRWTPGPSWPAANRSRLAGMGRPDLARPSIRPGPHGGLSRGDTATRSAAVRALQAPKAELEGSHFAEELQ